jgi:GrpB-like predicted nucleotidyltransferase (UPF0157 family)
MVDPDPSWPARFAAEAARIRAALGPVALRVDHVGSTAIPGLAAKPIIDIQISVAQVQPMDPYRPALEGLGYRHTPYPDPDGVVRYPFFGKPPTRPRAFHIHLAQAGSQHERRHLAVRDFLRTHPDQAHAYERVKRAAAARHPGDRLGYMAAKQAFVDDLEQRNHSVLAGRGGQPREKVQPRAAPRCRRKLAERQAARLRAAARCSIRVCRTVMA